MSLEPRGLDHFLARGVVVSLPCYLCYNYRRCYICITAVANAIATGTSATDTKVDDNNDNGIHYYLNKKSLHYYLIKTGDKST